jgi:hypothetical protein
MGPKGDLPKSSWIRLISSPRWTGFSGTRFLTGFAVFDRNFFVCLYLYDITFFYACVFPD